jgi:hypothetical protein
MQSLKKGKHIASSPFKTKAEIAAEYKISVRALKMKLLEHNIVLPNGKVSPKDQSRIYEALGKPIAELPPTAPNTTPPSVRR